MTAIPPLSFTDIVDYQPRVEPHLTLVPPSRRELDADRIIATWQHTTRDTLATMRVETPRLTAFNVIYDIVTAIRRRSE